MDDSHLFPPDTCPDLRELSTLFAAPVQWGGNWGLRDENATMRYDRFRPAPAPAPAPARGGGRARSHRPPPSPSGAGRRLLGVPGTTRLAREPRRGSRRWIFARGSA